MTSRFRYNGKFFLCSLTNTRVQVNGNYAFIVIKMKCICFGYLFQKPAIYFCDLKKFQRKKKLKMQVAIMDSFSRVRTLQFRESMILHVFAKKAKIVKTDPIKVFILVTLTCHFLRATKALRRVVLMITVSVFNLFV